MGRDGTMNLVTGIWAGIKELIKGENKMEKKPIKKYIVMSKFKSQNNFIQDNFRRKKPNITGILIFFCFL